MILFKQLTINPHDDLKYVKIVRGLFGHVRLVTSPIKVGPGIYKASTIDVLDNRILSLSLSAKLPKIEVRYNYSLESVNAAKYLEQYSEHDLGFENELVNAIFNNIIIVQSSANTIDKEVLEYLVLSAARKYNVTYDLKIHG